MGLGLSDLAETQKPGDPDPVAEIPSSPPPPALDPVVLTLEPDQDNVVATNSLEAELRQDPGKQALSKAGDGDGESEVSVDSPWDPWQGGSFPLENFVAYTSPFGYRQHPFGGWRFHYGLDLAAPMGSYIRSWWEGKIVEVSDDTACGTSIVIESGDWIHIYCHMQGYVVIEPDGDRWLVDNAGGVQLRQETTVYTGQRIGRVGMTGRTTGPHLHWGLKYQNRWVDPAMVVRAMLASQGE
ncbi:M23 family metallopeptidase [Leptolyngbya sp. PCC 6406]|uniref:M23 family metallopeptidase n=1 Tax=Leptolyngbya sp. PCC 6406 TaxID=1173264 RepID=UPI0002FF6302|nr:M23 family metallopeptidase [Leptolyngbya sp. PCC 6406]